MRRLLVATAFAIWLTGVGMDITYTEAAPNPLLSRSIRISMMPFDAIKSLCRESYPNEIP
ncbi:hypothetical protein AAAC51_43760 [Priestia megaterium]